jgi:hypothetical protein
MLRMIRKMKRKDLISPERELRVCFSVIIAEFDLVGVAAEKLNDRPDLPGEQFLLGKRLGERNDVEEGYGEIGKHLTRYNNLRIEGKFHGGG